MRGRNSVLTWNTGLKAWKAAAKVQPHKIQNVTRALDLVARWHKPSVIALQEVGASAAEEVTKLLATDYEIKGPTARGIMTAFLRTDWPSVTDGDEMGGGRVVRHVCLSSSKTEVVVYNFHCASQGNGGRAAPIRTLDDFVREREVYVSGKAPVPHEILCGDFNLDPYDEALRLKSKIGGTRCREFVVARNKPTESRRWYYNPCWRLMFSHWGGYGSYHYPNNSDQDPWKVLDQIMFSAGLLEQVQDVCAVVTCEPSVWSERTFLRKSKNMPIPDKDMYSDHLPVIASFQLP